MMNLLAIDTSTEHASVAILINGTFYTEEQTCQKTHAQVILPIIERLLVRADTTLNNLDGLVFGCGPGSFTGLRIACSISKGLAYALNLDLFPVSTLAAITWSARQALNDDTLEVLSVVDARMKELYWGVFKSTQYEAQEKVGKPEEIITVYNQPIVLAGVGFDVYLEQMTTSIREQISHCLTVYPSAVAMIEMVTQLNWPRIDVAQAKPVYVRNRVTHKET